MKNGIYWNPESEVYGLWKDGMWVMISVLEQDCVDAAVSLGMSPSVVH